MDILTWKNKQKTGVIFLTINLIFYLVVLGNYTVVSILSYVGIILILAINTRRSSKGTSSSEKEYLYVSRETIENAFVWSFEATQTVFNHFNQSLERNVLTLVGLISLSWISQLVGSSVLAWIGFLLAFTLTPQYKLNQELVDAQISSLYSKFNEFKTTLYELIPKYRKNN
jgi:small-conductance mechanosensitive channel